MPRPPRGGGYRGGGRPRPGTARIGGLDIAYDDELQPALQGRPQPTPLYPEYHITPPKPLTKEEKLQVARFCAVRRRIREGPLYAAASESARVSKVSGRRNTTGPVDPFTGVETYSQRYAKKDRRLPRLESMRYSLRCFPKELQLMLQRKQGKANGVTLPKRPQGKLPNGDKTKVDETLDQLDEDDEAPEQQQDEDAMEEDADDEYATDEDDEGGDYNAEQYFDDGGDDGGGDDYDAGGGEDGGDF